MKTLRLVCLALWLATVAGRAVDPLAAIAQSPIKGGLCVVLGAADAELPRTLAAGSAFSVHLLAGGDVTPAREAWHAQGLSGRVTAETWSEPHLPFMDNLVSLLVVLDRRTVTEAELLRVLRPGGELLERAGAGWQRTLKPRPAALDEWPQWRHGADRNAVSRDTAVDVPRRVQWLFSSTVVLEAADLVTAHGRVFIQDRDVLLARDGVLHVFYLGFKKWKWKGVNPTDETQSDLWTTRSSDNGATWSEPQMIFKGYTGASNGAIETREGHLIVPYSHYVNDPDRLVNQASVSTDGGKTWSLSNDIDIGGAGDHEGALEPCVIELKDGRVWMLIRTSRKFFWESFSTDGGKTWSEAKATTIDANSSPGHLTRLADGRIALVWNRAEKKRTELHLALSADEGKTWTPSLNLAKGTPGGATYPFVIEIDPGELWIGYHNVPKGWNFPRARHLRVSVAAVMENAGR